MSGLRMAQQNSPPARLQSITLSDHPYQNQMNITGESAFSSITSKTAANVLIPKPHVTRRKNQNGGVSEEGGYE